MFHSLVKDESLRLGTSALRPLAVQGRQSNPFYGAGPELFCQGNFKGCLHYNSFLYLLVKSRSKDCLYGKGAHYLGTAFYPAEHAQRSRVEIREQEGNGPLDLRRQGL